MADGEPFTAICHPPSAIRHPPSAIRHLPSAIYNAPMFIGHHAAAFAAKRVAPRVSLGTLMAAAMFLDLLWPILTLAGVEHFRVDPGNTAFTPLAFDDYPITHSLAMALVWSLLAFLVLIDIANIVSPPPPSWRAVAYTALAAWLFVPWAWWIDRHRQAR